MSAMSDFAALGSALYSRLGSALAGGSVYYALGPQDATRYPVIVFQRIGAVDGYTFGTANTEDVNADYLVKVVGNGQYPTALYALYGSVHARMQHAPLTVTGWTALRCERRSTVEYRDNDGYWHVGGLYRIELDK